mgnify:FL=1
MRTRTTETTLYRFEELTEKAQEKALEHLWDINVEHDWWDFVAEDIRSFGEASGLGCKYGKEFDFDRGAYVHITNCCATFSELLANKDKAEYEYPNIYAEALGPFLGQFSARDCRNLARLERTGDLGYLSGETSTDRRGIRMDIDCYQGGQDYPRITALLDRLTAAWEEFLRDLEHAYLGMLRREYEYETSAEAIRETVIANEYEFTEDGELDH